MLRRARLVVVCAWLFAALMTSSAARAQTVGGVPTIMASGQPVPTRTVNGAQVQPRSSTLNPTGLNYDDCTADMTLNFSVLLSNFDGNQLMEIWAGTTDCTPDTARALGGFAAPTCWQVVPPLSGIRATTTLAVPVSVRVQDIVSHLNGPPSTPSYVPADISACTSQTVDTAQSVSLYFLPTTSSGMLWSGATSYPYPVKTDLVGPPPPTNMTILAGDTLLAVSWTPNNDADTAGYAVYIDPIRNQEGPVPDAAAGAGNGNCGSAVLWGNSSSVTGDGSSPVAPADADAAAQTDANADADALADNAQADAEADAADAVSLVDSSTGTASSAGAGISMVSPANLLDINSATGSTVAGISTATYTIKGLKNGVTYNVAVAAVDAFGNIGPPSGPSSKSCDFPALVNDFWKIYRADGGGAGGGFCALEAVGAPGGSTVAFGGVGATAVALLRRRRRPR